jgi:hypothetical protein
MAGRVGRCGAVTLAVMVVALHSAASGNAAGWSLQQAAIPDGPPNGQLSADSCAGEFCMAVGSHTDRTATTAPFAEAREDGIWSIQAAPSPSGSTSASLAGVSCVTPTSCVAVGSFVGSDGSTGALAERWDGTSWQLAAVPVPSDVASSQLRAVSCSSSSRCTAVGDTADASGVVSTLIERWDGASWAIQSSPNPAGATRISLEGISCTADTKCTAVGAADSRTLAEAWNGSAWSIQTTPNPVPAPFGPNGDLHAVSCTSSTACTAVGSWSRGSQTATLAERWDGSNWTLQTTPDVANTVAVLVAVSCGSSSSCVATGTTGSDGPGPRAALAEAWDGAVWTQQSAATPPGAVLASLAGVSCPSSGSCVAVGGNRFGEGPTRQDLTLAESLDRGTWSIEATPNPPGPAFSVLGGVSCTAPNACTAVGYVEGPSKTVTLAERWNGTEWTIQDTPNPAGDKTSRLTGVSCSSQSLCTAVGYSFETGTIIERWDGHAWTIQPSPNAPNALSSYLNGVSCPTDGSCVAVGNSNGATSVGNGGTLIERWDGGGWQIQSSPSSNEESAALNGVSCTSPSACTAVGQSGSGPTAITERWDGSSWTEQPPPDGTLLAVSCAASTECAAAGNVFNGTQVTQIASRWDGTSWASEPLPPVGSGADGQLRGVACPSTASCTTVGSLFPTGRILSLAYRWDGSSWAAQDTPNPATQNELNGVSCPSVNYCVAVGTATAKTGLPLIMVSQGAGAPSAKTGSASPIKRHRATVHGSLDLAGGSLRSCQFDWGVTDQYGHSVACARTGGSPTSSVPVMAVLTGLVPGTTYHYSVRVITDGGSATGADRTFTTPSRTRLMTLGNASVGDVSTSFVADTKRANSYVLPRSGWLQGIDIYLQRGANTGRQIMSGVVYADASGAPGGLLAQTEPFTFRSGGSAGWNELRFRLPVGLPRGTYWLGVLTGGRDQVAGWRYDVVPRSRDYNANPFRSGPSNPFGSYFQDDLQMSLFARYRPGPVPRSRSRPQRTRRARLLGHRTLERGRR